jgi:hypothetical protein
MKSFRYIVWLVVLPVILLIIAWRMSGYLLQDQVAIRAERERAELAARELAQATAAAVEADRLLQQGIDARRRLASQCVTQALRGLGIEPGTLVPMLFVLQQQACAADCPTEESARQLVNEYYLEGLQVVLIRTAQTERQRPSPAGVPTVSIPSCAPLVADHGDDYFLRMADGTLGSSGERHEHLLRSTEEEPVSPPFDPATLVRQGLGLTPRQ